MVMIEITLIDRLKTFIECEGKSCSFDPELITPEYVYRMLFGIEAEMDRTLERPLSKLKRDILKLEGIIV